MIDKPFLLLIALLYVFLLFAVAWRADQHKQWLQRFRPLVYSLALAVYCSSWTFFGAVGQAVTNLWSYLPIYLGPMLLFLFGSGFLHKLTLVGERQKVTSIADFIGSRYGKSQKLSALVTLLAIAGSLPYIALQLRAVTMAWNTVGAWSTTVVEDSEAVGAFTAEAVFFNLDTALVTALLMGVFAILFGTRQLEGRERNRGIVAAIALESVVKLLAFSSVAVFAVWLLFFNPRFSESFTYFSALDPIWWEFSLDTNFITQTLLATAAIVCLPRQFHMAVVEYHDARDLNSARWFLPLYLLLFSLLILPLAICGHLLYSESGTAPDSLVLTLPMQEGFSSLTLLAFVGGFSAATGMVIVAAVTLAVMISNEWVAPLWLRLSECTSLSAAGLGSHLQLIRRVSILVLLLLGWSVHRVISGMEGLADIGLLAFSASAQLAPALVAGLYWRQAHRHGVLAGLVAGYGLWFYCLLLPATFPELALVKQGPWEIASLRPEQLLGLWGLDPLSHGVFLSLLVNLLLFVVVSLVSRPEVNDRVQAEAFVKGLELDFLSQSNGLALTAIHMGQLRSLLEPFLGGVRLEEVWGDFERRSKQRLLADDAAPRFVVREAEIILAGIVGSATAHRVIDLLRRNRPLQLEDIARLVDGTSQKLRFSQRLLQTTVETVSQGISVVDAELRLVAWNTHYRRLFDYPERLLYIGCPIANLYRFNAEHGLYGDNLNNREMDIQVNKRLELLRHGSAHRFERHLPNGIIIEVRGNPMPSGGFVTTYTDISDYRAVVDALEESKQTLEERVQRRTEDLSNANAALQSENQRRARAEAQLRDLHAAKTRFLAHTSHDLLQPINAARLFVAALQQKVARGGWREMVEDINNVDSALNSAEELIGALREISRLDAGGLTPNREHFNINQLLRALAIECQAMASARQLRLHYISCSVWVYSDRYLLRRILQNFLSNALRYTLRGRVVLGCRRRPGSLEIQVWDSGPGIAAAEQERIFEEFVRLAPVEKGTDKGLGLGLSIARRSAELLGHPVRLHSEEGRGALFSVRVPLGDASRREVRKLAATTVAGDLVGVRVLCVDNDPVILQGMQSLLQGWGCQVAVAVSLEKALEVCADRPRPEIALVDYHLDCNATGLDALEGLAQTWGELPPAILVSADISESVRNSAHERGFHYLSKPVKPAVLRSLIRRLIRQARLRAG